jgi:tetratricopeptide (TPR) repeat protein
MAKNDAPLFDDEDLTGGPSTESAARGAAWITSLVVMVAVVIGGWYLFSNMKVSAAEKQTAVFYQAYSVYEAAIADQDTTNRLTRLEEAAIEADKLANDLGSTPLGALSLLLSGNARFEASNGQPREKAIELLEQALAVYDRLIAAAKDNRTKAIGLLARGNTLENLTFRGKGERSEEALKAYRQAADLAKGTAIDLEARLSEGRLLLGLKGRESEARKVLESVVEDSHRAHNEGLTANMHALTPLTTQTIRTQTQNKVLTVDQLDQIRRMSYTTLGTMAQELLDRLPALTDLGTTGTVSR